MLEPECPFSFLLYFFCTDVSQIDLSGASARTDAADKLIKEAADLHINIFEIRMVLQALSIF